MLFSFQSPVSPVSVPSSFLPVRSRSFPSAFDCFSVFRFRFLPVTSLWPLPAPLQGTSLYHCRFLLSSTFLLTFYVLLTKVLLAATLDIISQFIIICQPFFTKKMINFVFVASMLVILAFFLIILDFFSLSILK